MIPNHISVEVSQAAQETNAKAIDAINESLPFLISLTPKEKQALPRIGDRSQPFVEKAMEIALQNPDILPKGFEITEMRKDVEALKALETIRLSLVQLLEKVEDTQLLIRSEAYAAALAVYFLVKSTGRGKGLETATDELGRRFARKLKQKTDSTNEPPSK